MDYDRNAQKKLRQPREHCEGRRRVLYAVWPVVLIGSGHDADAVETVRNANNRCDGSVDKVDFTVLEVHGCKTPKTRKTSQVKSTRDKLFARTVKHNRKFA